MNFDSPATLSSLYRLTCGRHFHRMAEMPGYGAQVLPSTDIPCPTCGYDLRGTIDAERCPECGNKLFPFELTERRNLQADALADDCRHMALRDALLTLGFLAATYVVFFDWRVAIGAIIAAPILINLLLSADSLLDASDSGLFDRFEYAVGRRTAFTEAKHMLKFPGLQRSTRQRLVRWYTISRTLLIVQGLSLVAYVGLLLWSMLR